MNGMLIDVSDYDMDTWDPGCFKARGVTGAITNSFQKSNAITRIQTLRAAGIPVIGVYGFCYFGPSEHYVNRDVDAAIDLAKMFSIPWVWVDAEADANSIAGLGHLRPSNPVERKTQLAEATRKVEAAGLKVGIYTAPWWWPSNMARDTSFSHLPLWHAEYGRKAEIIPPVTHVTYGGWTKVAIHQYTSTKPLCGRGRDHNYYLFEEDDVELAARIDRIERIVAAHGVAVIGPDGLVSRGADGNPLLITGDEALELLATNGQSAFLALQLQDDRIAALEQKAAAIEDPKGWVQTRFSQVESAHRAHVDNHAAGVTGPVEEHGHAGLSKDGGRVMR